MVGVGVTAVQERGKERQRERNKERKRGGESDSCPARQAQPHTAMGWIAYYSLAAHRHQRSQQLLRSCGALHGQYTER